MSKYKPGPYLTSMSEEDLQELLPKLKDDLKTTRTHLIVPTQDAIDLVEQELQTRLGR